MNDHTTIIEAFSQASKKPFAQGGAKILFHIPALDFEPYVLAVSKADLASAGENFEGFLLQSTCLKTNLFFKASQAIWALFGLGEARHEAAFSIPYYGLPKESFGQPLIAIPSTTEQTPRLAIHRRIEGITLQEFFDLEPNDAEEIMAGWPQSTFDSVMEQALTVQKSGNSIDGCPTNILVQKPYSDNPSLHIIDLHYNALHRSEPDAVFAFFSRYSVYERLNKPNYEMPEELLDKLAKAAIKIGYGIPTEAGETASGRLGFFMPEAHAEKVTQQLLAISSSLELPKKRVSLPPPTELAEIGTLPLAATLGELRNYLLKIEEFAKKY